MSATESVNATSSSSSSTTITAAAAAASTGSKPVVKLPAVVEKEHRGEKAEGPPLSTYL
jgi:hypothetical protein